MKLTKTKFPIVAAIMAATFSLAGCPGLKAQDLLQYSINEKGDTVFFDSVAPAYSFAAMKKKELKQYKRLVKDFSTVYPYSLLARRLVHDADSTFMADHYNKRKREQYVNDLQKRIISSYEKTARGMTMSQGQLMMRLIDRETSRSTYDLIKDFKSGIAAGFWQGLAGIFGVDMKKHYDPNGADKNTEDLIRKWDKGEFPEYYKALFGKYPVIPEIPDKMKKYLE